MMTSSRAAIVSALILALLFGLVWLKRSRIPIAAIGIALVLLVGLAVTTDFRAVQEHVAQTNGNSLMVARKQIWNAGLVAWRKFPLFGVGMKNYGQITDDKLKAWVGEEGKDYDPSKYRANEHAHNLYLNTLVERGAVGFAALAAVMLTWVYCLYRRIPGREEGDLAWALWGGSLSAWFVTVAVGLFNTTLHHEHAILAALLLGMWLSYCKYAAGLPTPSR